MYTVTWNYGELDLGRKWRFLSLSWLNQEPFQEGS